MTNSRTKGSRNERNVAKFMTDWTGYEFARTPQSGGLHWKKKHTSGDIVCIDDKHGPRFQFSIECKFHEELDLLYLIQGLVGKKTNKIVLFWEQTVKDAEQVKKIPLLFMRRNGMKAGMHFVVMPTNFFLLWLSSIEPWSPKHGIIHFTSVESEHTITIINSEDLYDSEYQVFHKTAWRVAKNVPV